MVLAALAWILVLALAAARRWQNWPLSVFAPRFLLIGVLLTALYAVLSYLLPISGFERAFPIDDSYITLTAARNFATRNLLAVNPAAPLAGVTSPLHVLLVGGLGKWIPVESADRLVGVAAMFLTVVGLFVWVRLLGGEALPAIFAALLAVAWGRLTFDALNGLETDLFAALLVWSLVVFEKSRARPAWSPVLGVLVALAILTRPEGYFLAAALALVRVGELLAAPDRRAVRYALLALALTVVLVVPYFIANYLALGHVFPSTVSAKRLFFTSSCPMFFEDMLVIAESLYLVYGSLLVLLPLLVFAAVWWRRAYAPLLVALFYAAYFVAFPGSLMHYWGRYTHPFALLVFAGFALGLWNLLDRLRARRAVLASVVGFGVLSFSLLAAGGANAVYKEMYRLAILEAREGGYLETLVDWIHANTAPGDLVAAHDIGFLYYFADRPILDLVGLTDPEVAAVYAHNPKPCGARVPRAPALYQLLRTRRPAIVLFFPEWNKRYLGLTRADRGHHLELAHHHRRVDLHEIQPEDKREFDIYRAVWDRDLRRPDS